MLMPEEKKKALNPTVIRLGLVSLFADLSSEMLYPITPLFLTAVLGASVFQVGVIEGLAEGIASLLKTSSGYWSDRLEKRKGFVAAGYFFAAIAKPLIGLSTSWTGVLAARGIDRFGKGIRSSPRDALLAESVEPSLLGAAFGWHRMMDTLGAALGPLAALLYLHFYQQVEQLRLIYFLALIPGLLAVFLVLSVREKSPAREAHGTSSLVPKLNIRFSSLSRDFKVYLAAWSVFCLGNSSDIFLLLRAKQAGLTLTTTILMYAFYNLSYALLSPSLGGLSDRIGRKKVLLAGLGIFALVYLLFSAATDPWHFWVLFAIYGIYMAATDGVGKALAVDLVPPQMKATGLGILGSATGFATIFASSVAGLLWDYWGSASTFYFGAAGALASALILATLKVSSQRP